MAVSPSTLLLKFTTRLRRIPLRVSRNPVEVIVVALLLSSACYYYLATLFPRFLLGHGNSLLTDSLLSDQSLLYFFQNGIHRPVFEQESSSCLHFYQSQVLDKGRLSPESNMEFLWMKQMLLVAPRSTRTNQRGVLTRRALKSLFALRRAVEYEGQAWSSKYDISLFDSCASGAAGDFKCAVFSATALWNHSLNVFNNDERFSDHIATVKRLNTHPSLEHVPLSVLFGGLEVDDDERSALTASSLVLTFVFNVTSEKEANALDKWSSSLSGLHTEFWLSHEEVMSKIERRQKQAGSIDHPMAWIASFAHGFWTIKDLIGVSYSALHLYLIQDNFRAPKRWI